MNAKQIRMRIIDLLDQHKETLYSCKGCEICSEIKRLRILLERDPAEKFQHILAKGQDMTKSNIEFLIENDVQMKIIKKSLKMQNNEFFEMMRNFNLSKKRKPKEDMEMAKVTQELYRVLSAQGLNDAQIARELGVKQPTISYYKQQWAKKDQEHTGEVETVSKTRSMPED